MVNLGGMFDTFKQLQKMKKINALLNKQKHSQNTLSDDEKAYVTLPVNDKKAVEGKQFIGKVSTPKKLDNINKIAVNHYILHEKTIYILPRLKPRKHQAENGDTTYDKHEWFEFYI